MAFGKANQSSHRRRPKKVEEIDEDELREKREERLNTQKIPVVITLIGSFVMLCIVVVGAPYSYGSQKIHYTPKNVADAHKLLKLDKKERAQAEEKLLIDFTSIVMPPSRAASETMKAVAQKCSQGRAATLAMIPPDKSHKAYAKATKFLTCAMATSPERFCLAEERQLLVEQLMDYKEKRQNVLAFEKMREKAIASRESYRDRMREQGGTVPPSLDFPDETLAEDINPNLLRQLENLVRNGFISPKDFGYHGLYVPVEYQSALSVGADRFAPCATRT